MLWLKLIDIFIRINLLIVIMYVLGTNHINQSYIFMFGIFGIFWIVQPLLELIYLKNEKPNSSNKC